MGNKPKTIQTANVSTSQDWGNLGSANDRGVNFNNTVNDTISTAQGGVNQYLKELLNPSYDNESFRARQSLLDQNNQQFANQLGANAIERGARGSATQNILDSIMANRNNDMRNALLAEDSRLANNIGVASGVESGYGNMANMMSNNILQRVLQNSNQQFQANQINAANKDAWNNAMTQLGVGGALQGAGLGFRLLGE